MPMSDTAQARLEAALADAIRRFGVAVFWNLRTDLPTAELAPVVIHALRTRGGVAGMRESARLERLFATT
jgi:hypothetical protein